MSRSNRRTRDKRQARRQGAAQAGGAPAADLVPHTNECSCPACEDKRKKQITRGVTATEKRLRCYARGDPHPEHRSEWRVSGHKLIAFFETHQARRDKKAHLTYVEMRPQFVAYLDGQVGEHPLDAGRLGEALLLLESVPALGGPQRARIIRACAIEGHSQDEVAQAEHCTQPTVSRNLEAGLASLLEIYGGLLLVEQQQAAS